jgi:hypothetical protein
MGLDKKDQLPIVNGSMGSGELVKPKAAGSASKTIAIAIAVVVTLLLAVVVVILVTLPGDKQDTLKDDDISGDNKEQAVSKVEATTQSTTTTTTTTTTEPPITETPKRSFADVIQWKSEKVDNCEYVLGEWTACNPRGMASRDDSLAATSDPTCYPERIKNKFCATGTTCLYGISGWGECIPDGTSWKTVRFLKGADTCENVTNRQSSQCNYDREAEKVKWIYTIADGCTYDVGEWSACNPRGMATRVDLLTTANSNTNCYVSKTKTKFCATQDTCL